MGEAFVGVQIAPHNFFDEGLDHCLDLLQDTAHVNALLTYSHSYHGYGLGGNMRTLAQDHGVPVKDPEGRRLPHVWVDTHEQYYGGTMLRHRRDTGREEYADRDIFAELIEPAHRRGMKVIPRILEGSGQHLARYLPNWIKVLSLDVYGRIHHLPCWNNPDYRGWWLSTVEDLFKSYPVDGLQWGAERVGPLPGLLFRGHVPSCFCDHCRSRNRAHGVDPLRAREGYRRLYELISGVAEGKAHPVDGVLVTVLRLLLHYPEILAWEQQWRMAQEELFQQIYGVAKTIRPDAHVGRHIDHQQSTWDTIYRAEVSYSDIADYCDFIKPILYHDIAGPRIKQWHLGRMHKRLMADVSLETGLSLFHAIMGYDPEAEPSLDEMDKKGFSPDYVFRETRRTVAGAAGKAKVYPGIGFDVPLDNEHFYSAPENVYQAVLKAFEAGADGVVASREYHEMRIDNLRAFGRAVGDAVGG
jgi:hypothetical protein